MMPRIVSLTNKEVIELRIENGYLRPFTIRPGMRIIEPSLSINQLGFGSEVCVDGYMFNKRNVFWVSMQRFIICLIGGVIGFVQNIIDHFEGAPLRLGKMLQRGI